MNPMLDQKRLEYAFQGRPDIIGAIQHAASAPNWIELFNEISSYVSDLRLANESVSSSDPASKKRKLDDEQTTAPAKNGRTVPVTDKSKTGETADEAATALTIKDISFVLPQRKKFTVEFTESGLRARSPANGDLMPGCAIAWKDISYAFCLPVPEKSQKQWDYVLFPPSSNIPGGASPDPIVFTIPATSPKPDSISGPLKSTATSVSDQHKSLFDYFLKKYLDAAGNKISIAEADPKRFASAIKEAYRPNEPAVHVKGFRGAKEGYLFFLPSGILWGFKKPLMFLPKDEIAAVSYTNVLQRTFNLTVEVFVKDGGGEEDKQEYEFSMIDQEEFAGIDAYVKKNGLQDASMAEQRRAKRLGINVVKNEDGEPVDVGDAGELEKAALSLQELEDEEDEEEEDYDPGSEGDSEGSGSSSSEEDSDVDGGGGGEDDDAEDDTEALSGLDDE